jgi:ACGX-repeat protein
MIKGWAEEEKGTSCGTACGASDPEQKSTACGTSCGASDK